MLPFARQAKLNPIIEALEKIDGCVEVVQDDFDSSAINVFLYLDEERLITVPHNLVRTTKAAVRRTLDGLKLSWSFLDWPTPEYDSSYDPMSQRTEKWFRGYSHNSIKIDISI